MAMAGNGKAKLTEEIGELIIELGQLLQVLGKVDAYGLGNHPDGEGNLLERFQNEAGDVKAALDFVSGKIGANLHAIEERRAIKIATYQQWDLEK